MDQAPTMLSKADQLKRGLDALRARASRGGITAAEVFSLTDPLMDILARNALDREQNCPGHVASDGDPKVCGRCGIHIDSLRPD